MKPKLLDSLGCNQSIYTEISFFLLADMFKSARNRVSDRKYKLGDIKVVECATLLREELVCSQASVLQFTSELYSELLNAAEQDV